MGLFNWLRDSLTGPAPPSPENKPEPPAGPPANWIDPAKEKRSAELAEQLGLSPQGRAEKYSKPQPPGGRLFVNGIEQPRPVRREQGFDVERLADRLDELAKVATQGPEAVRRNFTMRVPAEPYRDADLVMSAAASLLRNRPAANHRSILDLEADFRAWYKNKYGEPYFGAIPIIVAIEWGQHLLQQHEGIDMGSEVIHDWASALTSFVDEIGGDGPSLWGWAGIVPTPKKIVDELRELVNHLEQRATASGAGAALDIAPPESVFLPARILAMCKRRGWSLKWADRGCYLHLESSELIESLRGKRGEPVAEAADVLLVLMSITEHAGIPWADVVKQASVTCGRLEDEGFLP